VHGMRSNITVLTCHPRMRASMEVGECLTMPRTHELLRVRLLSFLGEE
jgi:hypothetical protein